MPYADLSRQHRDMTVAKKKPRSLNRKPNPSANYLGPEMDVLLRKAAKEAKGKPLSETLNPESGSLLSQMIGRIVEISMEEEMTEHLGYDKNERASAPRPNHRNGHSKKTLKTSQGETEIKVPRDRQSSFEPQVVPARSSITETLEQRIIGMYTRGMTTRDIEEHLHEMYGVDANPTFISRLTARLDVELAEWRNRPLEAVYAIAFVDAIHIKVRHPQGIRSTAAYLVCAYNQNGQLEILGVYMAPEGQTGEAASFWHQVFIELQGRGVEDILMICGDGLTGLQDAAQMVWPQTEFHPCVVHLVRNSTRLVVTKDRKSLCADLRAIYKAPTFEAAKLALDAFEKSWKAKYPSVVKKWRENIDELQVLWRYSAPLRKMVYTTNAIENVNRQVRKTFKPRGSMPNRESALRLMTLALKRVDEKNRNKSRPRPDWRRIVAELHMHFPDRLPDHWGMESLSN